LYLAFEGWSLKTEWTTFSQESLIVQFDYTKVYRFSIECITMHVHAIIWAIANKQLVQF